MNLKNYFYLNNQRNAFLMQSLEEMERKEKQLKFALIICVVLVFIAVILLAVNLSLDYLN